MVVRYLVRDVPEMAEQAAKLIDGEEDLWVTGVVLAEVSYVLRSTYLLPRETVIGHLSSFLGRQNISCYGLDKGTVLQALLMCLPSGRTSIADAMIWAAARSSGRNVVYSFDQRFPSDGIEVRTGQ
ncbi:MAG: PIN domain-containing protein [Chloroflexi bacterium]|nr:PIN domain-containing protein [Chloroflexota bacterium]